MNLKLTLSTLLVGIYGASFGGTFTGLSLYGTSTVTGTQYHGSYSATAGVKTTIPQAYFNVQAAAQASASSGSNDNGNASVTITAQFELSWKQTVLNEATPSTIYHHHTLSSAVAQQFNLPGLGQGHTRASIYGNSPLNGDEVYDDRYSPGTYGSSSSNTTTATYSFTPSWVYVSTDGSGMKTYKTTTPVISTATADVYIGLVRYFGGGGGLPAMGTVSASADDNFYFDVV